jgi:hypothetical protein
MRNNGNHCFSRMFSMSLFEKGYEKENWKLGDIYDVVPR